MLGLRNLDAIMRHSAITLLLGLSFISIAVAQHGPAMACTAPTGPLQATVCADTDLSAADTRLRELERSVAAATARPATLAHRARDWQRHVEAGERDSAGGPTRPFARDDLLAEYQERIETLEEQLRQDRAMRRLAQRRDGNGRNTTIIPRPANLESACLGAVLQSCRVSAAGMTTSEDGRTRILWQLQRGFTDVAGVRDGVVLLSEVRGGWRLLGWSFEGHTYEPPRLITQDGMVLLHLPGLAGGSGARNADLLYSFRAEGWQEVETESWWNALPVRLPRGLEVWQAVRYDFAEPTARADLWRDGDANCCPTGGRAWLDLRIEGQSVRLAGERLDDTARATSARAVVCPAERATYRPDAPADFVAELRGGLPGAGAASDLVLQLRSLTSERSWWFVFAAAQGYGGLSILPVEPPGPQTAEDGLIAAEVDEDVIPRLGFFALNERLAVQGMPPRSGTTAPRHIFMPGLGALLYYGGLPESQEREQLPITLWTLAECMPE